MEKIEPPHVAVILVAPQMSENIGAAARVMSNFGIRSLRIVNPRDGWPSDKAVQLAAHGEFILKEAIIYNELNAAIEDLTFIIATTATSRNLNKEVISPRKAIEIACLQASQGNRVGIMLGRESTGLTNNELEYADVIATIPTSSLNRSLNLAQALAIIAYEYMLHVIQHENNEKDKYLPYAELNSGAIAPRREIKSFLDRLVPILERERFFSIPQKRDQMLNKLRTMLIKAKLSSSELRILHGILRALS